MSRGEEIGGKGETTAVEGWSSASSTDALIELLARLGIAVRLTLRRLPRKDPAA